MSVDAEQHILNIKEEEYPEKHRPLIRRLQAAILEPEMRKQMEIEDGILDDFEDMQRKIQRQSHEIAEAERVADEARQEIAEVKREADEARRETAKAKREADEGKKTVARNLKAAGIALTTIMLATGLSKEEAENA
jgi:septal ring factor EnvC (AmiA/AmiB activator)